MKVLIIEPNPHHFEVIPGYVYYFVRLGYDVDCLVQNIAWYGDPFARCPNLKEKIKLYNYAANERRQTITKLEEEENYDFVFLTSIDYIEDGVCKNFLQEIDIYDQSHLGVIGCCHALSELMANYQSEYLPKERLVFLSSNKKEKDDFSEVNPNFFCDDIIRKRKNNTTCIVSIGLSADRYTLWHAIKKARKKGEQINLVCISGRKITLTRIIKYVTWKILRIRALSNSRNLPQIIVQNCTEHGLSILGNLSFPNMFNEIDKADFLDASVLDNMREEFSTTRTSGTKQLSLGFLKPCIIERRIAEHFGFSEQNAIIYEEGCIEEAILRAARMTESEYSRMVSELDKMCTKVRSRSLRNLEYKICQLVKTNNSRLPVTREGEYYE